MEYRAVLFDYGGVLTSSIAGSFAAFCLATGVSPDRMRAVLASAYGLPERPGGGAAPGSPSGLEGLVEAVETGRMSDDEFQRRLAMALSDGLPEPIHPAGLTDRLFGGLQRDELMLGAVRAIREAGLGTGVISNTWGRHTTPPGEEHLFDVFIRSGVEGLRKPFPEIYLLAAERLGVRPAQCVFIDDILVNVEGAQAVGMTGILHKDPAITLPKLEDLLGITLTGAG